MDRSEIYNFLPIVALFAWMMIITPFFPMEYRRTAGMLGMVVCIVGMIMTEQVLKWTAASYTSIEAICRPSNRKLHLFVKNIETAEITPGVFATKLNLGEKVKHEFYQILEYIVVKHTLTFEDRFRFTPGKAMYKGYVVDHPKTAKIILYEPYEGSFDVDHLSPIPVFWLKEAPGDYYLPSETVMGHNPTSNPSEAFEKSKVLMDNERLESENVEWKRQAMDWHQKAVRLEEVNDQIKNELHAILSSKSDQKQGVIEQVLTLLEGHTKIRAALKEVKGPTLTLTKTVAMVILGLAIIGVFVMNPGDLMSWLSIKENQFFIILLVGISVFAYYYAMKKRK